MATEKVKSDWKGAIIVGIILVTLFCIYCYGYTFWSDNNKEWRDARRLGIQIQAMEEAEANQNKVKVKVKAKEAEPKDLFFQTQEANRKKESKSSGVWRNLD